MSKDAPTYTLKLSGRIIEVRMLKHQSPEGLVRLKEEIIHTSGNDKLDILVDTSAITESDPATRDAAEHFFEGLPYSRYAVYGGNHPINLSVMNLFRALAVGDNVKVFRREEDARTWLSSSDG